MRELSVQPLTRAAFAPFGEVIMLEGAQHYPINQGRTERYHDLARIQVSAGGGRPLLNVFRGLPSYLPVEVRLLERHPLGSQCFVPLHGARMLVVVAPPGELDESALKAFLTTGDQGVNYVPGTWHHPLLALDQGGDFLVVDRGGPSDNCEERELGSPRLIRALPE